MILDDSLLSGLRTCYCIYQLYVEVNMINDHMICSMSSIYALWMADGKLFHQGIPVDETTQTPMCENRKATTQPRAGKDEQLLSNHFLVIFYVGMSEN